MISTRRATKAGGATGRLQRDCPLCGSAGLDYEFIVDNCPVCSCRDCALMFLNPQPAASVEAPGPSAVYEFQSTNAAERMRRFVAYVGSAGGQLLLVGADDSLAEQATKLGFSAVHWTLAELEESRLNPPPALHFHACVLYCSLERSDDPLATLEAVRLLIGPGGSLMVIAPTLDSRTARIFGAGWWEFARRNLFYFTTDTLQSMLIKAGFGDPVIMSDDTVVSLQYMRQKLAVSPRRWRYRMLRLLLSLSPGFIRNRTFKFLHSRTLMMVRPKTTQAVPRLSVIVPVYNEKGTFSELMETLIAKEMDGVDIDVTVVESNSSDGSRELVRHYEGHPSRESHSRRSTPRKGACREDRLSSCLGRRHPDPGCRP